MSSGSISSLFQLRGQISNQLGTMPPFSWGTHREEIRTMAVRVSKHQRGSASKQLRLPGVKWKMADKVSERILSQPASKAWPELGLFPSKGGPKDFLASILEGRRTQRLGPRMPGQAFLGVHSHPLHREVQSKTQLCMDDPS